MLDEFDVRKRRGHRRARILNAVAIVDCEEAMGGRPRRAQIDEACHATGFTRQEVRRLMGRRWEGSRSSRR